MSQNIFSPTVYEGLSGRALDADLYGPEQQGSDHENISATGNLNLGDLMRYAEHARAIITGGHLDNDALVDNNPVALGQCLRRAAWRAIGQSRYGL